MKVWAAKSASVTKMLRNLRFMETRGPTKFYSKITHSSWGKKWNYKLVNRGLKKLQCGHFTFLLTSYDGYTVTTRDAISVSSTTMKSASH